MAAFRRRRPADAHSRTVSEYVGDLGHAAGRFGPSRRGSLIPGKRMGILTGAAPIACSPDRSVGAVRASGGIAERAFMFVPALCSGLLTSYKD
jgi:hypothetical protein